LDILVFNRVGLVVLGLKNVVTFLDKIELEISQVTLVLSNHIVISINGIISNLDLINNVLEVDWNILVGFFA